MSPHPASSLPSATSHLMNLHRTFGNQAVGRLSRQSGIKSRESGAMQAKLTINRPDDIYEQEADRVADQVMRMPEEENKLHLSASTISHSEIHNRRSAKQLKSGRPFAKTPLCGVEEAAQTKSIAEQIMPLVQRPLERQTKSGHEEDSMEGDGPNSSFMQRREENEEEEDMLAQMKQADTVPVQRQEKKPEGKPIQMQQQARRAPCLQGRLEARLSNLQGGEPLSASTRAIFEPRFGLDLRHVRVHTSGAAAETAKKINAQAFTRGRDIVFGPGRYQPLTPGGQHLLAHELTHVVQQQFGAKREAAIQRQPAHGRSRKPFTRILALQDRAAGAILSLVDELNRLPNPTQPLLLRRDTLLQMATEERKLAEGAHVVVDAYVAGRPYDRPDITGDALNYVYNDLPNRRGLKRLEQIYVALFTVINLVRSRAIAVARMADIFAGGAAPEKMREAFHSVAGYYLDLIGTARFSGSNYIQRFQFLEVFYQNPRLIQGYGLWAQIRTLLPELYENFYQASQGGKLQIVFRRTLTGTEKEISREVLSLFPASSRGQARRVEELRKTYNNLLFLKRGEGLVGVLPRSLDEVRMLPGRESNEALARLITDVQVRIAVLRLWQPCDPLRSLLAREIYAGTGWGWNSGDRERWLHELTALEDEFAAELRNETHPRIETQIDDWAKRLQRLIDEIPPEVRRRAVVAGVVEQIPFMFVAGGTTMKVGMWVRRATQARWIVALAEGATMTAFSFAGTPVNAPTRPRTALGWGAQFALNVLFFRAGRLFFDMAGDIATQTAISRSILATVGTRIVLPTVALSSLQSGVQMIEQRIMKQGGDSNFTELLTINLILNGLMLIIGVSTTLPERQPASMALTTKRQAVPAALPTPSELSQRFGVSEDVARQVLEIAARMSEHRARVQAIQEAAQRGILTREQFEAMRLQTLDLAYFLEACLPEMARTGLLGDVTPTQIIAALSAYRARVRGYTYSGRGKIRALLPQNIKGLVRAGSRQTWAYRQDQPPSKLGVLRADYESRGVVRDLPSGGWEAFDPQGKLLLQAVPISAQAMQALSRSLESAARGPLAQEGLDRIRSQTAIPPNLLEARLQEALSRSGGSRGVQRILQHLARFIDPAHTSAWIGLNKYFEFGGNADLLARSMAYGQPVEFSLESRLLANKLLSLMANWDETAFRGFHALYRIRPRLTAARLHNLVSDFQPEQVRGIFQSLAILEPRSKGLNGVIGPLSSGAEMSGRGAMGALTSGVQLLQRFPQAHLVFEAEVRDASGALIRVIDISVRERQTTRIAGVTKTRDVEIGAFEIKEVSGRSFGRRVFQELARDIVRDHQLRSERVAPAAGSRPFFETFTWRIRGNEIRQKAIKELHNPDATEDQIDAQMRHIVEKRLEGVFNHPEFKALPQHVQEGYRSAFRGVRFVEFF